MMDTLILEIQTKCVAFIHGSSGIETGIKDYQNTKCVVVAGGSGTYVTVISNKIIVTGYVSGGSEMNLNVFYPLREILGLKRLLESNRKKILGVLPEKFTFKKVSGYWELTSESAQEWLILANLLPPEK